MIQHKDLDDPQTREVIVVGGGIAGLSAAIYLGRAQRDTLVIDSGHSMAKWEPVVENYLGFPNGVGGEELLKNGCRQARRYQVRFAHDKIKTVSSTKSGFVLKGKNKTYRTKRLLLATGIFHLPPEIPGVNECLGHSMFFCKDCDGYRVRGKRIAIIGSNNEAVEYALGMLHYSACVILATNGKKARLGQAARALAGGIRNSGGTQTHHRRRTPQAEDPRARFRGRDVCEDRLHFHHARRYFSHRSGGKAPRETGRGRADRSRPMHADECAGTLRRRVRDAGKLPDDHRRRSGRRGRAGDQSRSFRGEPRDPLVAAISRGAVGR